MDPSSFGRGVKALRQRKRWRQEDLAAAAQVSRSAVGRIERGHADRVTVATLDKVAAALGGRVTCRLTWNGEGLDRLLDAEHAAIVEAVVRALRAADWLVATEVSFSIYGERGSIDVLAFHPSARVLLVVEVKSVVPDVQATLVTLDRKERVGTDRSRAPTARRREPDGASQGRGARGDVRKHLPASSPRDQAMDRRARLPAPAAGPLVLVRRYSGER